MNPLKLKSTPPVTHLWTRLGTRWRRSQPPAPATSPGEPSSPTTSATLDPLSKIGTYLESVRQEQTKTLADISATTMIPTRILAAIEQGQSERLPEPVFVKGMIRRYGDALNLDGSHLAAQLSPAPLPVSATAPTARPTSPKKSAAVALQFRPIYLYFLYVVILLAAGSGVFYFRNHPQLTPARSSASTAPETQKRQSSGAKPERLALATGSATQAVPTAAQNPEQKTVPTEPAVSGASAPSGAPVRAKLSIQQQAWIEIVADGQSVFSGNLAPGNSKTVTAEDKLVIRTGNAGGVLLSVNDKPGKLMGAPGEVVREFVVDAQSLDASSNTANHT